MKKFVVVRDARENRTVWAEEVEDSAAGLHAALHRYPDRGRYRADVYYGRSWQELVLSYPRLAD